MRIHSTTQTLTGYLGRDVKVQILPEKEYIRTVPDEIADGEVTVHHTTPTREFATVSLAVHENTPRGRKTSWKTLRAWDLDSHPNEGAIRTARKGQRVTIDAYPEEHRYTDSESGEEKVFRYLVITSFRRTPGRLLRPARS